MTWSQRTLRYGLPLLLLAPLAYRGGSLMLQSAPSKQYSSAMAMGGKELFLHEWKANDPLAGSGDGLGPVFNAASCVACHRSGGVGGGGPLENNVTAFTTRSMTPRPGAPANRRQRELSLPTEDRQGVVHSFATDPSFRETLAVVNTSFPAVSSPPLADLLPVNANPSCPAPPKIGSAPGVDFSQRNTPSLFGANLIDAIPDRAIIAHERMQRLKWGLATSATEEFPVGRALRLARNRVGKFGWKAQKASLDDFVRAACANELGLGNPSDAQPAPMTKASYNPPGLDLTDEQCEQLTAFISSLPRPIETAAEPHDRIGESGRALFHSVGCADCHTSDLGGVRGMYSDLLLHRMGRDLVGGGSYGDPAIDLPDVDDDGEPDPSEWRTPPLWGVADSAPYLHDGRAASLEEAIRLHGGQGAKSASRFAGLDQLSQVKLLNFLRSLRAPQDTLPVPQTMIAATADAR